ncbi:MAG: S8 family serine peptidase [Anaeromyxobacteraceae bacterium]
MAHRSRLVLTFALAVAGCARGPAQQDRTSGGPALHPDAVAQMEAIIAAKQARTPAQLKVSSQLLYLRDGLPGAEVKGGGLESMEQRDELNRVLVDLKGDLGGELDVDVALLGGKVVNRLPSHRSARVWIDLGRLEDLASLRGVQAVKMAYLAATTRHDPPASAGLKASFNVTRAEQLAATRKALGEMAFAPRSSTAAVSDGGATTFAGAATSAGSNAHNADAARKFYDVDGTGVKVGVLSDSDDFKEASIASGDLPADTVTIPGQDGRPGSGEGTAMMEIVHDVAPGAKLFFATAFNSPESFADNIRALRFTYGCDVIVDDIIYYFESPYQDDIIAQAVADVTADGAVYVSSAGNQGNFNDGTSGTWEGDFTSAGTFATLPSGYEVHDFGNGAVSNRIELGGGPIILHWADPGTLDAPASGSDYDIFVLTPDLRSVAVAATDIQDGDDLPFEFLGFNVPAEYRVVIAKKAGAPDRALRTVIFAGEYGIATHGSTYGHSAAQDAISAAAVDVAQAGAGQFVGGPTTQVELYSADGPRPIFYDRSGNLIGPAATYLEGQPEWRWKPDLAGADGVSTTLPSGSGLNPFFGTSAAAPHIGGLAALVKQGNPVEDGWHVTQALLNSAIDIEAAGGWDRDSGMGIPEAKTALQNIGAKPAVHLAVQSTTATPGGGATAINPGGSGTLSVTLLNEGGAQARNVVGALTSGTPGVTVTGGTSAYPNLASGASGANVTPFAFTVDPSVTCGQRLSFNLSVAFRGNGTSPAAFAVAAQTGAPSATATAFSFTGPRAAIPDNNAAGVNVAIPVSGVGVVGGLTFSIDGTTCSTAVGSTTVGLDHSWVGDLVAKLTSPSGVTVTLFSRPGGTSNSGNNFCKTVLSDAGATSIQNITSSGAPWTGTFKPASPLSAFVGTTADGTWTFNVSDLVSTDTGSVRAVTLNLAGFSCGP